MGHPPDVRFARAFLLLACRLWLNLKVRPIIPSVIAPPGVDADAIVGAIEYVIARALQCAVLVDPRPCHRTSHGPWARQSTTVVAAEVGGVNADAGTALDHIVARASQLAPIITRDRYPLAVLLRRRDADGRK